MRSPGSPNHAVPELPRGAESGSAGVLRTAALVAGLVVAALVAYRPALTAGFVELDDGSLLTRNPVLSAAAPLLDIWMGKGSPEYFPLTLTSFWVERQLWGLDPTPYHVANVLLHALSAVLVWRVLAALRIPGAWFAALVFAVHPAATMSVAWVSERKNTLSCALYLLSIASFLRFEREGKRRWYVAALGLFVLGALAKAAVVVLPAVLLVLAWWQRGAVDRRDVVRAAPFLAGSAVFGALNVSLHHLHAVGADVVQGDGLIARIVGASWRFWIYLGHAVAPFRLRVFYPRLSLDLSSPLSYVPLVAAIAVPLVLWRVRRRAWGRGALAAYAYHAVTIAPVLGLIDMYWLKLTSVADHLQYYSLIGVVAFCAGAGATALRGAPAVRAVAGAGVVATLALLTSRYAAAFESTDTLYAEAARLTPTSAFARYNVGFRLAEDGRAEEALPHLRAAVELEPDHPHARVYLGILLARSGQPDAALREFLLALRFSPDVEEARHNIRVLVSRSRWEPGGGALARFRIASALLAEGRVDEAREQLGALLSAPPADPAVRCVAGAILLEHGLRARARAEYEAVLRVDRRDVGARRGVRIADAPPT